MTIRKLLFVVFSTQLLISAVTESNIPDDAETALKYLADEIGHSLYQISVLIPNTWSTYVNSTEETILRQLKYDIDIFTVVIKNLTEFADTVTSGNDCVSGLEIYLDIDNYDVDVVSTDRDVYKNQLVLANREVGNIVKEFDDLYTESRENCGDNTTKCESTRKLVIAEVERLTPAIKKIEYDLLAEVHLLGYRLISNWEVLHTILVKDINKVVQNATICLAYTFERVDLVRIDSVSHTFQESDIEMDVKEPVSEAYVKLIVAAENAMSSTLSSLLRYTTKVLFQCEGENDITMSNARNAIFIANQTVNALFKVAADFNVTTTCTSPDLVSVLNSSIVRGFKEYTRNIGVVENIFEEGVYGINITFKEITSLGLQVAACSDDTCDFLAEKLTTKTTTLPLNIRNKGSSTAVMLYQPLLSVLESRSKIVMDVIEQLEADIVALKSCIRVSLCIDSL